MAEFPYVVQRGLSDLDVHDIVAQCMSIHLRLAPVTAEWLGCPALYTLGWIDDGTQRGMFKFDDAFIEDKLWNGHNAGTINIHAWLTLPSMEVIDMALITTMAIAQGRPEGTGRIVMGYADQFKGFAYKPMLVGSDFLTRIGVMIGILEP